MQRKPDSAESSSSGTEKPPRLELCPDRAFVLHLDRRARPPRHLVGRIEHVTSGRVARITSLRELLDFMAKVLDEGAAAAPCESPGTGERR